MSKSLASIPLVFLVITFSACSLNHPENIEEPTDLEFVVGFDDPTLMKGVDVILLAKDGRSLSLGKTNGSGVLKVDRDFILRQGQAVIFCREGFFCGSLLVTSDDFREYKEHYIELAPLAWQ